MPKQDKATQEYYDSIMINKDEYKRTVETAKRHHQHAFKKTNGVSGAVFYDCPCGAHYAVEPRREL